jgi:5-formyltetrahydrofolate cyclo-ligase
VYLARDGELDLQPLVERAWAAGKRTYLPALWRGRLAFLPHQRDSAMRRNRFGIPEPAVGPRRRASPCALDLVLMPLVAFGAGGARLGMGGGFYDRTFAASVHRRHWRRPLLVGVGYAFQRVQPLPAQPWDVPLHGVVTEAGAEWF